MAKTRVGSFQRRLTGHALVTAGVALTLTLAAVGAHEIWNARAAVVRESIVQSDIIGANTAAALVFGDPDSATEVLSSLRNEGRVVSACLYDTSGEVFARYATRLARQAPCPRVEAPGHRFIGMRVWLFREVAYGSGPAGTLFLELTLSDLRATLFRYAVFAVLAGLLGLLLAGLVAGRLQRSLMRPVGELSRVARRVKEQRDYSARAAIVSDDELGELTGAFNEMLEHIETTESALRQQQKLEAIGTLASGVAHEINNPLTFILGNLEWLQDQFAGLTRDLPEARREEIMRATAQAIDGSLRVREIVTGLNAFARRHDEGTFAPVDLRSALEAAIRLADNKIRHAAVLEADLAELPPVLGHAGQLTQVFLNLIINALHAMEGQDPKRNRLRIALRADGDHAVAEVSDTGTGIAPEALARIFDPFFTTKDVGKGTGLGLFLCRDIISAMHGRIEVRTEQGVGTTFTVILPLSSTPPRASAAQPEAVVSRAGRLRVLVVDDEAAIVDALGRMLPEHDVVGTTSGREAVELCRTQVFDVVLCDIMMPEVSGQVVYEQLGALSTALQRRMIFMTGGAFTDEARAFVATISNPLLKKPLEASELRKTIAAVADHSDSR